MPVFSVKLQPGDCSLVVVASCKISRDTWINAAEQFSWITTVTAVDDLRFGSPDYYYQLGTTFKHDDFRNKSPYYADAPSMAEKAAKDLQERLVEPYITM